MIALEVNQNHKGVEKMKKLKVLFFGAGVLGSLYAAKFKEAGMDVALVARGKRVEELRENGIVLQDFKTEERTTTKIRVLDGMPEKEYFDVCIVMIQRTHLTEALKDLAKNKKIPTFLFMQNKVTGPEEMVEALGRDRVMIGHCNAGGERQGQVVHYMIAEEMPLGELNGEKTERLERLAEAFKAAGFKNYFSKNIDSWKRYHVALAVPFALAMYNNDSCNYKMAENREDCRRAWRGIKEAFRVLRDRGFPVEPPKFRLIFAMPEFLVLPLFQRILKTKIADIGMARHLRNAQEEMDLLTEEFFEIADGSKVSTPVLDELRFNQNSQQQAIS